MRKRKNPFRKGVDPDSPAFPTLKQLKKIQEIRNKRISDEIERLGPIIETDEPVVINLSDISYPKKFRVGPLNVKQVKSPQKPPSKVHGRTNRNLLSYRSTFSMKRKKSKRKKKRSKKRRSRKRRSKKRRSRKRRSRKRRSRKRRSRKFRHNSILAELHNAQRSNRKLQTEIAVAKNNLRTLSRTVIEMFGQRKKEKFKSIYLIKF